MKETMYRFAAPNILKVTAFASTLVLTSVAAMTIMLIRILPFGFDGVIGALVAATGLLMAITIWVAKVWWFDFARFLLGVKQFRTIKGLVYLSLALSILLIAVHAYGFWVTEDIVSIVRLLTTSLILFGGNSAITILEPYLNYRREYPQREIEFLAYCNETQGTK